MSTPNRSAEELRADVEQQQAEAEAQVKAAGEAAEQEAQQQGLSEDEVKTRVEAARKEEKDKLYPQLEALKSSLREIQETLRAEREEKERIKREAEEEAEKKRQARLSDSERHTEALKRIEEQLKEEREARLKLESDAIEERKKTRLAEYRRKVLQAAGDEIIPDLVQGNSEEEIDKSVEIAKARYAEFAERFKAEHGATVRGSMPRPTNPDTAALEEQDYDEQLSAVDMKRFKSDEKYRDQVKDMLANAYSRTAGRR